MKKFLLLVYCTLATMVVSAQYFNMDVKVTGLGANYTEDNSYGARFRFYRGAVSGSSLFIPYVGYCIKRDKYFSSSEDINFTVWSNWGQTTNLILVTHHERKADSDDCTAQDVSGITFRKPDVHEAATTSYINPTSIPQGVFVSLGRMNVYHEGTTAYADVSVRVPVLAPSAPSLSDGLGNYNTFCANSTVNASATPQYNGSGLNYVWEYAIEDDDVMITNPDKCFCAELDPYNGCGYWYTYTEIDPWDGRENTYTVWMTSDDCYKPDMVVAHNWHPLTTTYNNNSMSFVPKNYLPGSVSTTKKLYFRVKAVSNNGLESPYSDVSTYFFLPPPPSIDQSKKVETPSCFQEDNGKVVIPASAISSNFGSIRCLIRNGSNNTGPCDPRVTSGDKACGDVDWSNGSVPSNQDIVINNLKPGSYSLWILNPGSDAGNCYSPIPVNITEMPELLLPANQMTTTNISCYGANDGKINVTATGGNPPAGYYFTLTDQLGNVKVAEQLGTGANMIWQNLPAGKYTAIVRNGGCNKPVSLKMELSEPPLLTGKVTLVQPDCNTPGNGIISIEATPVTSGYQYLLYQDGSIIKQSSTIVNANYAFTDLKSGTYKVSVLDGNYLSCPGWDTTVTFDPVPALTIKLEERDSVACNGGSDGRVLFSATGGSEQFRYQLTDAAGITQNSTTGEFKNLKAGTYTAAVLNKATTCDDAATTTVEIYQRTPLAVTLTKTDVTCNGAANGTLTAQASGGSSSYKYTWQQLKGSNWTGSGFWYSTDTKIEQLEPGTYRVIITDLKSAAVCSVTSANIDITENPTVVLDAVTVTDAICLAEGAQLNASATGGTGTYTFAWSLDNGANYTPFTSPGVIHTAGKYLVKVTDGNGCTDVSSSKTTITLPATALDFNAALSDYNGFNISCSGAADGRITITTSGGNGGAYTGYSYKLNNGDYQASNIFNNLTAGVYNVTVKDGRGCEVTKSFTLVQPQIKIAATQQNIICYGAATGTFKVDVSGGAAPYQLTLNGNAITAGQQVDNLAKGDYTLHIKDANGCTRDTVISIIYIYPELLITTASIADIRCLGETGSLNLAAAGGDNNYTFRISTDNWTSANTYTSGAPLNAGTYRVRVTDGKGCTVNNADALTITAPPSVVDFTAVLSDYNGYNVSCVGGNNGYAQLTATGGNGSAYSGYTYAIDNQAFGANAMIQSINAGPHQLKVKDARGCVVTKSITFTESANPLNIILGSKQDVRCAATPGGSITVKGSGGVGQLSYSIDGGTNWQTDATFSGLVAGNYQILVSDVNNCSKALDVTVNSLNPSIIIDNITSKDIVCYGSTATVTVQSHGGSGVLTSQYSLNGGAYTNFNASTAFYAGSYTIRVADANGCYSSVSDPVAITTPSAPLAANITTSDFNGRQVSCYGLQDGAISIVASGGNDGNYNGYQYSINANTYTDAGTYNDLAAGTYNINIKDDRGCIINKSVTLTQPAAAVALNVTNIEHLVCGADPTGKITLNATGGTTPYSYSINPAGVNNTNTFSNLEAGNYTLQVQDVNGCSATTTAKVNALYTALNATADITAANCFGETSGSIRITALGGDGSYAYHWKNDAGTGTTADRLAAGTYNLLITDGKGCSRSFDYTVEQPDLLTLSLSSQPVCDGLADGTIAAVASGGTQPYSYAINNNAFAGNDRFINIAPGSYNVQVKDAHGCITKQDLAIAKANVKPDIDFLVASRKNAMDTLAIREINLPAPDKVNWAFHPSAILLGSSDGAPLVKFTAPGTYWIEMQATFGDCTYTLRKNITIDNYDPTAGPAYIAPIQVIDAATLSPNPNSGSFKVHVKLNRKQQAVITIYDVIGNIYDKRRYEPGMTIDDQFNIPNALAGTYILRVVTENESRDVRFVITH